jgi:hypothetical protein
MDLVIYKYDKPIAKLLDKAISNSKVSELDLPILKNLIVDYITFKQKRHEILLKGGYVPVELVTDINKITKSISDFKEKYKIKGDMFEVLV